MFIALELSLDVIASLRTIVNALKTRDRELHDQIRRAASSICLNLAEGRRRSGCDRLHFWRVAAGSADELRTALRVAEAWGILEPEATLSAHRLLDQVLAILWRVTR